MRQPLILLLMLFIHAGCKNGHDRLRTWSIYKGDAASSSFSPLNEINLQNIHQLKIAWISPMNDAFDTSQTARSECNPIIIDDVMYATSARHRVYAIDAATGKQIWTLDPFNGGEGGGVCRGVTYWENGNDKRILFTAGDHLFAVDAKTGKVITSFGDHGKVSMNNGFRGDPAKISVIPTSPGIVYRNLLIMGTEVSELYGAEPGYIQAYDIVTGKLAWTFHTIPFPGEPGYETWPPDGWKNSGGVNDWAGMSLDTGRGLVFLALGSPTYDFYGADRKGQNLYGNCVVALRAGTGKYQWHFQTIHHDLWDYDLPAPPNLVTITRNGKKIDAVAQVSKVGFVYILNRETGEPLFPVEERKVPASLVPGEEAWPTQPFPLKPRPFARQILTENDLADFSPGSHEQLIKTFRALRYDGLFTPPDLRGTLNFPGSRGGAEWGGAAYDPAREILFVRSNDSPEIDSLQIVRHDENAGKRTLQGKAFYNAYCQSCHGSDRNGNLPEYPSLLGIKNKRSKTSVLAKISQGGGKMPAFASVLKGHEDAIIGYLFDSSDRRAAHAEADLQEIKKNRSSQKISNQKDQADTSATYLNLTAYGFFKGPDGHPGIKPPFGTLSAINLSSGEYEWQVPLGNQPELQRRSAPLTGSVGSPGPIVTAGGLIFIGESRDKKFRAFNTITGKLLWETTLPGAVTATACTYMSRGKQYVAVSLAGDRKNPGGYVVAFALH